jgi:Tol biopolymer transport system component
MRIILDYRVLASLAIIVLAIAAIIIFRFRGRPLECEFTQITVTQSGQNIEPSISADGRWIAFESSANITGGNPDGNNELFFYDRDTTTISQLTGTTGGTYVAPHPKINSNDGTRIVFSSRMDLTGGNPDGSPEVYMVDTPTSNISQITNYTSGYNFPYPDINADGTKITFESLLDLTGGNSDGNVEIFVFDTSTGDFDQITDTRFIRGTEHSAVPSISGDGRYIAFQSAQDFTGNNSDHNEEIFIVDRNTGLFTQITKTTTGLKRFPNISTDGTGIVFESNADLTGENADGNTEVFLYDTTSRTFTQITKTTGDVFGFRPHSINENGTRVAFSSEFNLTGDDHGRYSDVFLYDTNRRAITRITTTLSSSKVRSSSISSDGTKIAFESADDLTGANPELNREIFLAECH